MKAHTTLISVLINIHEVIMLNSHVKLGFHICIVSVASNCFIGYKSLYLNFTSYFEHTRIVFVYIINAYNSAPYLCVCRNVTN